MKKTFEIEGETIFDTTTTEDFRHMVSAALNKFYCGIWHVREVAPDAKDARIEELERELLVARAREKQPIYIQTTPPPLTLASPAPDPLLDIAARMMAARISTQWGYGTDPKQNAAVAFDDAAALLAEYQKRSGK